MPGGFQRRSLRAAVLGGRCLDLLGGDERDAVLLAGSARSGTTWIASRIADAGRMRLIFEPLYPEKVAVFRGLSRKPYLRSEDPHPEYEVPLREVLEGRVRSRWFDRHCSRCFVRGRLVKEVRANLMLGWFRKRFPKTRIIFVLRHPCAVAASRLELGWPDGLADITSRPSLLEDYPEPLGSLVPSAKTPLERAVLAWCAENHIALSNLGDNAHVVAYEDLLIHPEREFERMRGFMGRDSRFAQRLLRGIEPRTVREGRATAWRDKFPAGASSRANEMMHAFGLDALYDAESGLPLPAARIGRIPLCGTGA